jgi:hypothetical protein
MCHLFAHEPQRGTLLVAQIAGADAAASCQADRWCDAVQAAMRDLPLHETIRAGSARSVAVQDRRQAGRQGGRLPHSAGFAKADFAWDDATGSTPGWQTRRQLFPAISSPTKACGEELLRC